MSKFTFSKLTIQSILLKIFLIQQNTIHIPDKITFILKCRINEIFSNFQRSLLHVWAHKLELQCVLALAFIREHLCISKQCNNLTHLNQ